LFRVSLCCRAYKTALRKTLGRINVSMFVLKYMLLAVVGSTIIDDQGFVCRFVVTKNPISRLHPAVKGKTATAAAVRKGCI